MSIKIDVSDFFEFADDCERAAAEAPQMLSNAAYELGTLVQQRVQQNAKPHRRTGSMENSITPSIVSVGPAKATAEVAVTRVSDTGFPYPVVIDQGRGGFTIVAKGKALALPFPETKGKRAGQIPMLRKKVTIKPYSGSQFFTRAVDDTRNNTADIDGTIDDFVVQPLLAILGD